MVPKDSTENVLHDEERVKDVKFRAKKNPRAGIPVGGQSLRSSGSQTSKRARPEGSQLGAEYYGNYDRTPTKAVSVRDAFAAPVKRSITALIV